MTAYFTAAKKAAIKAKLRAAIKRDFATVLDELALGLAHDIADEATARGSAITAAVNAKIVASQALLNLTPSSDYTGSELESVADKIDAVITAMKASGIMASS